MARVHRFDTELMSTIIGNIKQVKAPDINGLCALQSTYTFVIHQFRFR